MAHRIQKVNELIKKELGQLILKEIDFPKEVLVTITRVESADDLCVARIYISSFPEKENSNVIQVLNNNIYELQQKLNKRLKMRPTPKIMFLKEGKTKEAGDIEKILDKIKK
ncbi:MAG: 30S ribosome-binding factor RbfA [Candidatus Nealsonbacteria bacterium]